MFRVQKSDFLECVRVEGYAHSDSLQSGEA